MSEGDLKKKETRRKPSLDRGGSRFRKKPFPTLAHIVLRNGVGVDIPKLPMNISELTSYDHLRIGMEHAALAMQCLNRLGSHLTPRLADGFNLAAIRLNLEDLMNHLYYAIELSQKPRDVV